MSRLRWTAGGPAGERLRLGGLVYFVSVTESLNLTIWYEANDDGRITAQVAELPGAISEGRTREEARTNVLDALQVLLTPDQELQRLRSDTDSESVTLKFDP